MEKQFLFVLLVILLIEDSSSICQDQGIIANPDDESCQTYIFCFRLPDGSFIEKSYNCPYGTLFNPLTENCDEKYVCDPSTTLSTSSVASGPPTVFECTAQGSYPEENDSTCTKFFFCYHLPSGKYLKKSYTCPMGTKFDPKLQTCTTKFDCPSSTTISTTPTTVQSTEMFSCVQQGRFPLEGDETCRSYYYCLYLPGGGFTQQILKCPTALKFDPKKQTCSGDYECSTSTTISTTPTSVQTTEMISCVQQGRFPMKGDVTCRLYYYCLYLPGGGFTQQIFKCPKALKFDPKTQTCSENYECTSSTTISSSLATMTPSTVSTVSSTVSSTVQSTTIQDFTCSTVGRFADLADPTCRTYFYCIQLPDGSLDFQKFKCPEDEAFDVNLQICNKSFKCPTGKLTAQSTTFSILTSGLTTSISISSKTISSSHATMTPYTVSSTVSTVLSPVSTVPSNLSTVPSTLSTVPSTLFTVPSTLSTVPSSLSTVPSTLSTVPSSLFTVPSSLSTVPFTLSTVPFTLSTVPSSVSTVPSTFSTLPSSLSTVPSTLSTVPSTLSTVPSTLSTVSSTVQSTTIQDFACSTVGRFADSADLTCRTYFYCIQLPSGTLDFQKFKCPEDEAFDPNLQICNKSFKCPTGKLTAQSTTFSILTGGLTAATSTEEISSTEGGTTDISTTDSGCTSTGIPQEYSVDVTN